MICERDIIDFLGDKFPARFSVDFFWPDGQFEEQGEACASRFKNFLINQGDKFSLIRNTNEHGEKGINDVSFYRFWGGFTFVHIVLFSSKTAHDFVHAIIEFSKNEGELNISSDGIKLTMRTI